MLKILKILLIFISVMAVGLIAAFKLLPNPLGVTDGKIIRTANEFAIFEALRVQKHIEEKNQCPSSMSEWASESRLTEFQYEVSIPKNAKSGQSIPIWYSCRKDLSFNVWVRHSIDSDISIVGGMNRQLEVKYGHFTDMKTLELRTSMELSDVFSLLRKAKLITNGST